jgi:hypothetical protein
MADFERNRGRVHAGLAHIAKVHRNDRFVELRSATECPVASGGPMRLPKMKGSRLRGGAVQVWRDCAHTGPSAPRNKKRGHLSARRRPGVAHGKTQTQGAARFGGRRGRRLRRVPRQLKSRRLRAFDSALIPPALVPARRGAAKLGARNIIFRRMLRAAFGLRLNLHWLVPSPAGA